MWLRRKKKIKRPFFRRLINYFIYVGVGIIILFLIAFGFTQTSTFRNWLNETITEQVNTSTNGSLSIDQIDGTIFTSIVLTNTLFLLENDTLFAAKKIEVKTSPLNILFKVVYFRKAEIENADIAFIKDENGELNISRILPPSDEPDDTTESVFSWNIRVADLQLKNVNFKLQAYDKKYSTQYYAHPNTDDFRLNNLNLKLSASADIENNEYELYLKKLNFTSNLTGFRLKKLSGNFVYFEDKAGVTDLNIVTDRSNISLSAAISEFPVFRDDELELSKAPIRVDLAATDFHFDDLTTFIDGTSILNGPVTTILSASGTLDDLEIEKLKVEIGQTKFELTGTLQSILSGGDMFIDTRFSNFSVNQEDIPNLLPSIGIPTFKEYGNLNFDSLYFKGKPLVFDAGFGLSTEKGFVSSLIMMDLRGEDILYKGRTETKNLNLFPVIGLQTNLNSSGSLTGTGFSPSSLKTDLNFNIRRSAIGSEYIDILNIKTTGRNGLISSSIDFGSSKSAGILVTDFNFTKEESTSYTFDIELKGFDIRNYIDGEFTTNLNIQLRGSGENFDPDDLNLFTVIQIDSSSLNGLSIDSTSIIIDIRKNEEERVLNIISDLADVTIAGKFTVTELIEALGLEIQILASTFERKIDAIQPPKFFDDTVVSQNLLLDEYEFKKVVANREFDIDYLLEFKDFELLSLLLGDSEIDVDGELTGKFSVSLDSVIMSLKTKINQLKYWNGSDLYYISELNLTMDIDDRVTQTSFEDFSANIDLSARRIFLGSEISDVQFELNMDRGLADLKLNLMFEDFMTFETFGKVDLTGNSVVVSLEDMEVIYNQFDLRNQGDILFSYSDDEFQISSFALAHKEGVIELLGNYSFSDYGEFSFSLNNIDGKDLSVNLFGIPPEKTPESEINLSLFYSGTPDNPLVSVDFSLDSVIADKVFLGFVQTDLDYQNKLLMADVKFFKTKNEIDNPWLGLNGNIPIDLSLDSDERLPRNKPFKVDFFANNFDLRFAGSIIPGITKLNGILEGDIKLSGNYEDIRTNGQLQVKYGSFTVDANNLIYLLETGIVIRDDELSIASFALSNDNDTKGGGKITASGRIVLDNFKPKEIDIKASGELKLLSEKSRAVNPNLYGDIAIRTRDDMRFLLNESRNSLSADLILKRGANVTFSSTQSAFSNESDKFSYIFIPAEDKTIDKEIDSLIIVSESIRDELDSASNIPFDLELRIQVENEAKMVFVLSREFKQNLTAYLGGEFEYTVVDNVPKAGGELRLLDGSKLDFIKTFQAQGSVKFLDEIDNPYLDVSSTYQSYYNPDTLTTSGNEYEVRIRINLEGPVKSINTNFIRDERNVEVYKRRTNFGQFELDASKSASDAMFFIIVGKFPEDASQQETNVAISTAASLAGSIVGGYLNEQLGDFVRSVNVQQVGTETKFSLIGKVGEVRYEIGGTSQVFQDLSRANIKIEYPFIFTRLILRLERREPTFQSTYGEMINELGLKYSFTF